MMLPIAPRDPVEDDGMLRFGRYTGLAESFGWTRLAPPFARGALWRRFHHKRWHFVALATDELFCALAVADLGWGNSVFGYAFDRRRRKLVGKFSNVGIPGVTARVGSHLREPSWFRWPGMFVDIEPVAEIDFAVRVKAGRFRIDAQYGGTAPCLLAVGEPQGGSVHATQKSGALPASGFVEAGGRRYSLAGGLASFDYSNGLLAHDTAWRWVSAHGLGIGINLQTGYFGANENALWIGERIVPLGAAQFEVMGDGPLADWHMRDDDGLIDLRFTPEGARRDDTQLFVASSRLVQQIGVFDGWVKASPEAEPRAVERLVGLTEHHHARW